MWAAAVWGHASYPEASACIRVHVLLQVHSFAFMWSSALNSLTYCCFCFSMALFLRPTVRPSSLLVSREQGNGPSGPKSKGTISTNSNDHGNNHDRHNSNDVSFDAKVETIEQRHSWRVQAPNVHGLCPRNHKGYGVLGTLWDQTM